MQGGSTGAVIEPGDPDSSRLWALVSHAEEPKMPPNQDKLPAAKLDVIKAWIAGGALENAGSVAKVKKKPTFDLSVTAGAGKPDGPPPMPEGLSRQPVVYTPRAARGDGAGRQPLGAAGRRGRAKAGRALQHRHRPAARRAAVSRGHAPRAQVQPQRRAAAGRRRHAAARSGSVVVFDVKTGKRVFEVGDEFDAVLAADINDDHTQIALGGPGRVVRIFSTADGSLRARDPQAHRLDLRRRVQPRRRAAGHGRPQRRPVRLGGRDGPRVSEPGRAQGGDHRRELADRFERAGQRAARTARSSSGKWKRARRSRTGPRMPAAPARSSSPRRQAGLGRPRSTDQDLGRQRRGDSRAGRLWRSGDWKSPSRTTRPASWPAIGWARCGCAEVADGKQVAALAANPPTLEMLVADAKGRRWPPPPPNAPRRPPPSWPPPRPWSPRKPRPARPPPRPPPPRRQASRAWWPRRPPSNSRSRRKPTRRNRRLAVARQSFERNC